MSEKRLSKTRRTPARQAPVSRRRRCYRPFLLREVGAQSRPFDVVDPVAALDGP
jgi:hypothetical protein